MVSDRPSEEGGVADDAEPATPAPARGPKPATEVAHPQARPTQPAVDFNAFYQEFVPTLVAFLLWQGAGLHDAADIAQDTMTRAYQYWERIEHPYAWARTVASRAYARRIASIEEEHPVDEVPETSPLLSDIDVAAFAERHVVLRVLALLPPRQRQVMAWTYDGYKPAEIAEELKIRPEAVRSNLRKARRALARHLATAEGADPR
jgi:RNA polymerase sigma-70 factor (ECF subfamily)